MLDALLIIPYYYGMNKPSPSARRIAALEDAKIVARGIKNQRQVKELLRQWEEETVHALAISGRKV
jgi:hypothetical protein